MTDWSLTVSLSPVIGKFHYRRARPDPTRQSPQTLLETRVPGWVRAGLRQSPRGLCLVGSGQARVVKFSCYDATPTDQATVHNTPRPLVPRLEHESSRLQVRGEVRFVAQSYE